MKIIKSDIEKYKQIAGPDQANNVAIVIPPKKQIKQIEVIHEEPLPETKLGIHGPIGRLNRFWSTCFIEWSVIP